MIPDFIDISGPWKVLPPGIHKATLEEVEQRFAINDRRRTLFQGFKNAIDALRIAGCKVVYLDGSYVTDKIYPGDFDVCWEPNSVDVSKLDPVFLDFNNRRRNQKLKFGGEFFPSSSKADGINEFVDFFQIDKDTGLAKGVICVQLN